MTDRHLRDELFVQLGRQVREDHADDARFEKVARDEADANVLAELERAALADDELERRLEGSRPLDDAAIDRIAGRIQQRMAPPPPVVLATWRRRIAFVVAPLALAAAAFFAVSTSAPGLPPYAISVTAEQAMRGPAETTARLHLGRPSTSDSRFEILLRPASAPASPVVAYAFRVAAPGAEPAPLDAKTDVSAQGAVRLVGKSSSLDSARELRVVIGEAATLGGIDSAAARAASLKSDRRVAVLVVPIDRD